MHKPFETHLHNIIAQAFMRHIYTISLLLVDYLKYVFTYSIVSSLCKCFIHITNIYIIRNFVPLYRKMWATHITNIYIYVCLYDIVSMSIYLIYYMFHVYGQGSIFIRIHNHTHLTLLIMM